MNTSQSAHDFADALDCTYWWWERRLLGCGREDEGGGRGVGWGGGAEREAEADGWTGVGWWGRGWGVGGWKEHVLEENSFAGLEGDQTGSLLGSEVFWSGDAKIEEVLASCLSTPRFRAGKANRTSR